MRRKLAAGNWKMHGVSAELSEISALLDAIDTPSCDVVICPPATLIERMAAVASRSALTVGAQDCHPSDKGAHTGDISAAMLRDAGASHVIVGHSERREDHGESDALVQQKAKAVLNEGLVAIICVGETLEERDSGQTLDVIGAQIKASVPDTAAHDTVVLAYEPVWAIGTGRTPTLEQIGEVHDFIRQTLREKLGAGQSERMRLLYGGSVKPSNAAEIFAIGNVDGALVGGASLKASDFSQIVSALAAS